ncbi:MAG: hypothetical protein COB20_06020 [SAR86 cluster bacterium]|uniref:Alpha/beta hydrolase n=1 Tax=SAR86 cluster bacterium TaxID=2030880 RepID=A0A2A4X8G2_9GAMM|nr:MAG: hypothetical protein COB20_06020 [SAR86 cluster bacterium]
MQNHYIAFSFTTLLAACSAVPVPIVVKHIDAPLRCAATQEFDFNAERTFEDHIVRVDNDGQLIPQDLTGLNFIQRSRVEVLTQEESAKMVSHLFCEAESLARTKAKGSKTDNIPVKLLIYVHGGLNSFGDTDTRIIEKKLPDQIINDADWHYPIFMSWPTAPVPTWAEQTFLVREGRKVPAALGIATSPFMITADIFRTLGRYPATAYYQLSNEIDQFASAYWPNTLSFAWKTAQQTVCNEISSDSELLLNSQCQFNELRNSEEYNLQANLSTYKVGKWERTAGASLQIAAAPFRYTLFSLWHSGIAASAWDNMKRRTQNMIQPPYYIDSRRTQGIAGAMFFEELFKRIDAQRELNTDLEYEITLVGHSMGAIVLNNILESFQLEWVTHKALKNIVYMAAASNIDETLDALAPVLNGASRIGKNVNFYNLTLNRVAEVSEKHLKGLVPLGSLLVSIDQHYDTPEHPLKRTMGSEVNILSTIGIIDDRLESSKGDLVFKAFNRCPNSPPRMHGEFNDIPFWKPSTWQLPAQTCSQRARNASSD